MTTSRAAVTVHCDEPGCTAKLPTARTTTAGARGDAARADWATSQQGPGYRPAGASSDHERPDFCPDHNPWSKPPQNEPDLFADQTRTAR